MGYKRQEISAQSCKIVGPLGHHSNYWVRSPSQEYPKCYYSEAPSMSCRQRDSGFRKYLVQVKCEADTENYRICAQGASGLTASHTHMWKH